MTALPPSDGLLHVLNATSSAAGRHVAWCVCGEHSTSRPSAGEAVRALAREHGRSELMCVLCGRERPEVDQPDGAPVHLRAAVDPEALAAALGHHDLQQGLVCVDDTNTCARLHIARRLPAAHAMSSATSSTTSSTTSRGPALRVLPGGPGGRA